MSRFAGTNATRRSSTVGKLDDDPSKADCGSGTDKWVQYYTERMMEVTKKWDLGLGIAMEYAEYLRKELRRMHDEPLMKTFVEANYPRHFPR